MILDFVCFDTKFNGFLDAAIVLLTFEARFLIENTRHQKENPFSHQHSPSPKHKSSLQHLKIKNFDDISL